jgi:hypothetical protein
MISDFRHKVAEDCPLLGYFAASSGNLLPEFRDNLSVPSSLNPNREVVQNTGKKLPLFAA